MVVATILPLIEQGVSSVPTGEFHGLAARVFGVVRERDASFAVDPSDARAVREECRSWVAARWLERSGDADGELYRVSPEARDSALRPHSTHRRTPTRSRPNTSL
jgi:hypothetical protein